MAEYNKNRLITDVNQHLFWASRQYSEEFDPILIVAEDIKEARQKAEYYFISSFVSVGSCRHSDRDRSVFVCD